MSSLQRPTAAATTQPEPSPHKKKFGKNLNKLTKPPAPPVANAGARQNASSRNGLLLLSTKRTPGTAAGGLLSGKSGRTSDSTTSNDHTNAAEGDGTAQNQPDAWGVAQQQQQQSETPQPALAPKGGVSSGYHQHAGPQYEDNRNRSYEVQAPRYERRSRYNDGDYPPEYSSRQVNDKQRSEMSGGGEDEQLAYMSRLARERSERRRNDEEARIREQKERAAKRLKELEGKMATTTTASDANDIRAVHNPSGVPLSMATPKPPVVLELLGRTKSGKESDGRVASGGDRGGTTTNTRTLFDPNRTDPNRTFSSLVGGNGGQNHERRGGASDDNSSQPDNHYGRNGSFDNTNNNNNNNEDVIQLASYEDRDRGERNTATGPRMLFDPKSGSMVAVKSRDEAGATGRGGGRKERAKAKGRNKDRDSPSGPKQANDGGMPIKPPRKIRGRKRGDSAEASDGKITRRGKGNNNNKQTKRLPRTCGVLYVRDEKGHCVCADGCDGDEGYGAHGVPGGRVMNPDAHAKFLEEQQQEQALYDDAGNYGGSAMNYLEEMQPYDAGMDTTMGGYSSGPSSSLADTPLTPQKVDWVKPNEKIELVTGVDDSPTLQATANPWAPSEAALAAAKQSIMKTNPVDGASMKSPPRAAVEHDDEDEDDTPSFIGLGFDPTANMDSVMRSPTNVHSSLTKKFDDVGLTSLALDADGDATTRNIFAFGSPTWGTSGAGRLSTWTDIGTGNKDDKFGTSSSQNADDNEQTVSGTSSFLSLSALSVNQEGNTWGTAGLNGLGGAALPSAHANDHGAD